MVIVPSIHLSTSHTDISLNKVTQSSFMEFIFSTIVLLGVSTFDVRYGDIASIKFDDVRLILKAFEYLV